MTEPTKTILRIEPSGEVFVFEKRAGESRELYDFFVVRCTGTVRFTVCPGSPAVAFAFYIEDKIWIEFFPDHINVMGKREDDPVRVFGMLVEWLHAGKVFTAKRGRPAVSLYTNRRADWGV